MRIKRYFTTVNEMFRLLSGNVPLGDFDEAGRDASDELRCRVPIFQMVCPVLFQALSSLLPRLLEKAVQNFEGDVVLCTIPCEQIVISRLSGISVLQEISHIIIVRFVGQTPIDGIVS